MTMSPELLTGGLDWPAVEGVVAVLTLAAATLGQVGLSVWRAGKNRQREDQGRKDLEAVGERLDALQDAAAAAQTQREDHERRIAQIEREIEPLRLTRDQFLELRGQSRAEHVAQNAVLEEIKIQLQSMGVQLGLRLDGLQRQITNVVMGSADRTEEVLPHPGRRRRGQP